jgi:ABC-type branched-subunit amino acid transport system ATPase component
MTTLLWFAYVSQAWNLMMGFAGQLSLGHSLYVGLGAYASAALFVHFGIGPWAGVWLGMTVAALAGAAIGVLGFRFGVRGVYFALLTIAFAELTRIGFDHIDWLGGAGGLFLPVPRHAAADLADLRGPPALFYYVILALTLGALLLCRWLLERRIGYFWRAIREDQEAAQAVGINVLRYKLAAVLISAAMTSVGGVFYAFFYNNLREPSHVVCNLGIGQVAEGRQIFPTLTVLENLEVGASIRRARTHMKASLAQVFEHFPRLAERRQQRAGTLSGGEQQMLAIGRCLMGRPELVMFDEPSLGLAPAVVRGMFQVIRELAAAGLTIILVEQNVAASLRLADQAHVLETGRIVLSGSGTAVLENPAMQQAYLGL